MTSNHSDKKLQSKKSLPKKWNGLKPSRFAKYRKLDQQRQPGNLRNLLQRRAGP